jgi:protein SCO1
MNSSPILLSARYDVPKQLRAKLNQGNHVYGHAQPSPDEIGGVLDFTDWRDQPVGAANFVGRWTLLYFGYCRCTGSCTTAVPLIVAASRELRSRGLTAKAAFVDIDAPPLGITRLETGGAKEMQHGANWEKRYAMRAMAREYGSDLMVLTGNRKQLAQAGIAYHVIREHIPPRPNETGHSINHSSLIYFIAPNMTVAGYGYHDSNVTVLADTISALDKAPQNNIALGITNRMAAASGCGPTGAVTVTSAL